MEDYSDFQIDFENLSGIPILLENDETHEENDLYEEIVQKGKKAYLCTASGCGKIFKFKSEITRHIIIHQRDRPYVCTFGDCKKNFKRADALENHLRIHEGILPFPCDVPGCDRSFVTKAALRYHKIKHNNDRSFKCEFSGCDKSFIIAFQLKQHYKAFPFHLNRQQETPAEDTPQKIMRQGTETQDVCNNDLFQAEDQDCCDKIQWEIYNQCHENLNENTQEKFETIFQYIRNENKILKGQLQVEKPSTKILQKKETVDFSYGDQTEPIIANEPSIFFDGNELKFLEFLKERDYDS